MFWSIISSSQTNDSLKFKKYSLTTSVLDYISEFRTFNEITYNIEFSAPLKKSFFLNINIGYLKSNDKESGKFFLSAFNNTLNSTQGYRIQLEGRHYLKKYKLFEPSLVLFWLGLFQYKSVIQDNTGYYIAFQNKYQNTVTERTETVLDYIIEQPFLKEVYKQNNYSVSSNLLGGYLKFGYNAIKKSGFTVDYAAGIGVANVSSSSKNKLGEGSDFDKSFDNGDRLFFDWTYTFKIGWSF